MAENGLTKSELATKSGLSDPPGDPDDNDFSRPVKPGDTDGTGSFDLEQLNAAIQVNLEMGEIEPSELPSSEEPVGEVETFCNEIAEDMLEVLKSLKELEIRQVEMGAQLEQMRQAQLATAREIDALRRDLLGERKTLASLSVFQAVVPWLDSLRIMHRQRHKKKDAGARRELQGIMDVLAMVLQGLGFVEFQVKPKEFFDPERMECCGYMEGPPGVVLALERPGYQNQGQVVRPAGVHIADPQKAGPKGSKRGSL